MQMRRNSFSPKGKFVSIFEYEEMLDISTFFFSFLFYLNLVQT
jgi:hypothetical protein